MASTTPRRTWWKESSIYQVYPSSFKDSNGDGVGDIPGIISKLDYLHSLGVDIIWLSPVYASPGKDMGYDISDYRAIDPKYGSMSDLEALVEGLHERGMKLVMDLVVNHTSDAHEWFRESRRSRDSEKREWYVWRDPKYDEHGNRLPPNNWLAVFGGSAWQYDEATGQYYLHCFLPEQPDLNWEHEPVRKAVHDMMKFWLDKRIDGFRMDVIELISKAAGFPDAPVILPGEPYQPAEKLFSNGPRLHEFLKEMRKEVLDKYDVMTVGEMPWMTDPKETLKVVGEGRGELDMIFQFDVITMDFGNNGRYSWPRKQWDLTTLKDAVEKWQVFMFENHGWNSVCLESHDQGRCVSRFVDRKLTEYDPVVRGRVAKMLATLEAGQSGTIYVYQGQELGMKNIPYDWPIEEYKDVETQNAYKLALKSGDKAKMQDFWRAAYLKARDHARTPVQWDSTSHSGFTTGTPWMRVNDDYSTWNAALQTSDESSVFSYWQQVLQLRKTYKDVLIYGDFEMLAREDKEVLVYKRAYEKQQALVVLNFTEKNVRWTPPGQVVELVTERLRRLGNYEELKVEGDKVVLRPFEAAIFVTEV